MYVLLLKDKSPLNKMEKLYSKPKKSLIVLARQLNVKNPKLEG